MGYQNLKANWIANDKTDSTGGVCTCEQQNGIVYWCAAPKFGAPRTVPATLSEPVDEDDKYKYDEARGSSGSRKTAQHCHTGVVCARKFDVCIPV